MAASQSPSGTAIVEGAKHWYASTDGHDIPDFMFGYTLDALNNINNLNESRRLNIIAESQAASCVLAILARDPTVVPVDRVVLVQPLGLNKSAFGKTSTQMIKEFRKRILRNTRYQLKPLLTDRSLRANHRQLFKYADMNNDVSRAQYAAGLAYDALDDLETVARHQRVSIICGGKDAIFPSDELSANLKSHNIPVSIDVVQGVPHSPLATRKGQKLLAKAFEMIYKDNDAVE